MWAITDVSRYYRGSFIPLELVIFIILRTHVSYSKITVHEDRTGSS